MSGAITWMTRFAGIVMFAGRSRGLWLKRGRVVGNELNNQGAKTPHSAMGCNRAYPPYALNSYR